MPIMKCSESGQSGWKYGESGKCYIGEKGKEEAVKQALAIGGGKMPKDSDEIEYLNDDIIIEDAEKKVMGFIPPPVPAGFPSEAFTILSHTYASVRKKWVEEHPGDPENSNNKQLAAQTAWSAVAKAGYKKNKEGKWSKDTCGEKKKDCFRYDVFDILEQNMTEPFKVTSEGYLKGRAIIANTGIQSYVQKDGTVLKELRTPEDVGNEDALNSFKNIVITNGHPKNGVNAENAKELQVGFTGSNVKFDGHAVSIDMTITDKKTIDEIKNSGKYAISAGYNADIEMKSGFAFGNNEYNAVQKNIRANHIAVNIDRARAGDLAKMKLRMDSLDAIHIDTSVAGDKNFKNRRNRMVNIKINDVEFQADERVAEEFNIIKKDNEKLNIDLAKAKTEYSTLQANHDVLADKLKKADTEVERLKKEVTDEAKIKQAVKARISLVDSAVKFGIEVKEDMDNIAIKKAIVLKAFSTLDLNDKDENYVNNVFDSAVISLSNAITAENKKQVFSIKKDNPEKKDSVEETYAKRQKRLWKLTSDQAEKYRRGEITDDIKKILDEEV